MRGRARRGNRVARAQRLICAALLGIGSLGAYADDTAPERCAEALDLLRQVEGSTPRPSMRIEDLVVRRKARERLVEEAAP